MKDAQAFGKTKNGLQCHVMFMQEVRVQAWGQTGLSALHSSKYQTWVLQARSREASPPELSSSARVAHPCC